MTNSEGTRPGTSESDAPASGAEELQKVFKTLADPTRVRILRLLEQEELIVGELMDILGMAQSRVSRHLAVLREAGLLSDRRDGTFVSYSLILPEAGPWTVGRGFGHIHGKALATTRIQGELSCQINRPLQSRPRIVPHAAIS